MLCLWHPSNCDADQELYQNCRIVGQRSLCLYSPVWSYYLSANLTERPLGSDNGAAGEELETHIDKHTPLLWFTLTSVASPQCLFSCLIEKSMGLLADNNLHKELKQGKCWWWSFFWAQTLHLIMEMWINVVNISDTCCHHEAGARNIWFIPETC